MELADFMGLPSSGFDWKTRHLEILTPRVPRKAAAAAAAALREAGSESRAAPSYFQPKDFGPGSIDRLPKGLPTSAD
jgi:hypothetical protein